MKFAFVLHLLISVVGATFFLEQWLLHLKEKLALWFHHGKLPDGHPDGQVPGIDDPDSKRPGPRPPGPCQNSPTSRGCWGDYSIDTDYYNVFPRTGRTVEVWLSIEETFCNPDGYERLCMTVNGTIPGPAIYADWGDHVVVHVTNNLRANGTAVHWHGVRQLGTVANDGVPGVTQCPTRPGDTMTYEFDVTQYGTSWYHSHFSLQYGDGVAGPLIFNGPATANYDIDLGPIFLHDWSHVPIFTAWDNTQKFAKPDTLDNLLINGTNTFDCSTVSDSQCVGGGKKFVTVFAPGKTHRLRLINTAVDSSFRFSIDGHTLTAIATDLVPIDPFATESILVHPGERYDILVKADAQPGDYWMRGGWIASCRGSPNKNDDMTGIVRYDARSQKTPGSRSDLGTPDVCADENASNLVPHLKQDVGRSVGTMFANVHQPLEGQFTNKGVFQWTLNESTFIIDWNEPTLKKIFENTPLPLEYNVVEVANDTTDEWAILVIQNTQQGVIKDLAHPIHLHGHDFAILAQVEDAIWDQRTESFNTKNPARRDTAMLPSRGYLAIAFPLGNPGAWLIHCHIAWHASQGFAFEFVENKHSIDVGYDEKATFYDTCKTWDQHSPYMPFKQDDSGI